jgi:hypothetical protein
MSTLNLFQTQPKTSAGWNSTFGLKVLEKKTRPLSGGEKDGKTHI